MDELVQYARILQELEIPHGFSTAVAGDAKDPAVRARLLEETGISAPLATASQVHGVAVRLPGAELPVEADALLAQPGRAVGVFTADCVPILLVDPGARLVAAVHAGWRGTLGGVLEAAVQHLAAAGARASGSSSCSRAADRRLLLRRRRGACTPILGSIWHRGHLRQWSRIQSRSGTGQPRGVVAAWPSRRSHRGPVCLHRLRKGRGGWVEILLLPPREGALRPPAVVRRASRMTAGRDLGGGERPFS